ncbi:DUF6282 family protein [Chloroflexota bacterium]
MAGRAYNPLGYEPELHGGLTKPPKEVMDTYAKIMAERRAKAKSFTFDEAREHLEHGEGDVLGHYIYEMMFDIYAGIEDEIMEGAIDTHLHIYPDYVPRTTDIIQLAIDASNAGYRAICCKDHFFNNVAGAWGAQWVVEDLVRRGELKRACKVFGTNMLAWSYHPDQIELISKYPNLGGVFFPTMTGGRPGRGGPLLPILDDNGKLMPEVKECIRRMADHHICVFSGHRIYPETLAMVQYCNEVGAHILLTHAGGRLSRIGAAGTVEQQKELIKLGAYIELSTHWFVGASAIWPVNDPTELPDYLKAMGPECIDHIVMGTDLGQPTVIHPIDGYRCSIRCLLHSGISKEDLKIICQKSGAEALYLDEKETTVHTVYTSQGG